MTQVFLDGLFLLTENLLTVLVLLGLLCFGCAKNFFPDKKGEEVFFSLASGIFLFISAILRLAYIKNLYLPPYFDSLTHYRLIRDISTGFLHLRDLLSSYYHLGYHFTVSLLTRILPAEEIDLMLIFGQMILAALPLPVLWLTYRFTRNKTAAFFAALLAGFGWYMPAFALNWGKYPALLGIFAFETVLLNFTSSQRKRTWLLVGVGIATLIHTRTLVLFALLWLSWQIAEKLTGREQEAHGLSGQGIWQLSAIVSPQLFFLLGEIALIALLAERIYRSPVLKLCLEPYLGGASIALLVFLPFAWRYFPRILFTVLSLIALSLLALFVPVDWLLHALPNQTLLDRPFVEMLLFLPLALLGGLEFAGFQQLLREKSGENALLERGIQIFSMIFLLLSGVFMVRQTDFYPSACCQFFHYDDAIAFDWLEQNIPPKSKILISAEPLSVLPESASADFVGTDAGIWLSALLRQETFSRSYQTDFSSAETHRSLCAAGVDYIYLGSTEKSFYPAALRQREDWYHELLRLPRVQIFRLEGCTRE